MLLALVKRVYSEIEIQRQDKFVPCPVGIPAHPILLTILVVGQSNAEVPLLICPR